MTLKLPIATRFALTLVVVLLVNTGLLLYFVQRDASRQISTEVGNSLAETALQLSDRLDKDMWARSRELDVFKKLNTFNFEGNIEAVQTAIDDLTRAIPSFSWIGFTDAQGLVLAATGRVLVGQDLSKRPVFSQAREKPFVGDVHDAVLLAKLLPNPSGEPMKFVDLSSPLFDAHKQFIGVLAAHLSWQWVREIEQIYFSPLYEKAGIEVFIVSADGLVLLGPTGLVGQPLALPLIAAAKGQTAQHQTLLWPDGAEYLTGAAYGGGYLEYPGLGWTVLARQPAAVAFRKIHELQKTILLIGVLVSLSAIAVGVAVSHHLTRPLQNIVAASRQLLAGKLSNIPPYIGIPDIEILTTALRNLIANLTQTTREKEQMEVMAFADRLTSLPNRAAFQKDVGAITSHAPRKSQAVGVLYLDLDGFKPVNDTLGHPVGDLVLQAVAIRLKGCLRQGDVAYRLGGDEFGLILQVDAGQAADALVASAARIIKSVNLPIPVGDHTVRVGCSIGGAVWPMDSASLDEVVCFADTALYASKKAGKNTFTLHQPGPLPHLS